MSIHFYEILNRRYELEALGDIAEWSVHLFHVNAECGFEFFSSRLVLDSAISLQRVVKCKGRRTKK